MAFGLRDDVDGSISTTRKEDCLTFFLEGSKSLEEHFVKGGTTRRIQPRLNTTGSQHLRGMDCRFLKERTRNSITSPHTRGYGFRNNVGITTVITSQGVRVRPWAGLLADPTM